MISRVMVFLGFGANNNDRFGFRLGTENGEGVIQETYWW